MILSEVDLINVARTRLGNASQSTVSQQVVSIQLDIDTKNYLGTNKKFANVVFNIVDVNGVATWAYEGYALSDTRSVPVLLNLPTLAILYDEWRSQGNNGAFIDFLNSLQGNQGFTGWTPILSQVPLTGGKVVVRLTSFVGGEGTLPSELQSKIGKYQKADGTFTSDVNEAQDIAAELKAIVEQNTEAVEGLAAEADADRIAAESARDIATEKLNAINVIAASIGEKMYPVYVKDKLLAFSTKEKQILLAISVLDVIVPDAQKADDWRINFVSTIPVTSGFVSAFKYRIMIRNFTTNMDITLVNENTTFDINSINGVKFYSGTATNGATSVEYNVGVDWKYLLSLGSTFEHFVNATTNNLRISVGNWEQTTTIDKRVKVLEGNNVSQSSQIAANSATINELYNSMSDFVAETVTIVDGFYASNGGSIISFANKSYILYNYTGGDIKITTTIDGNPLSAAIYRNAANAVIGTELLGINGVPTTYTDYSLTIPAGTTSIYFNKNTNFPFVLKKKKVIAKAASVQSLDILTSRVAASENTYNGILSGYNVKATSIVDGSYYSTAPIVNASFRYTSINATNADKLKVSTKISGEALYLAIYLNQSGGVIGNQNRGTNGVVDTYTDFELTIPAGTATVIINGIISSAIIVKKKELLEKVVASVEFDALTTRVSNSEADILFLKYPIYLKDKLLSFSTKEKQILLAISVLDIIVPDAQKADDWRINFVSTIPVTSGFVSAFKYRIMIRNFTTNMDITLVNENTTFDINSINGVKFYSGTATNGATSVEYNVGVDWKYLLSLGSTFEHFVNATTNNLKISVGNWEQTTTIDKRVKVLEANIPQSQWTGKKILWLGTSIPAGGLYPTQSASKLGAVGINKAVGSSMVRKAKVDGSINGLAWQNVAYCLSQTITEKQDLIDNWNYYKTILGNSPPSALLQTDIDFILSCSYESRLLPYLNGTLEMPSLFIFDHGHNDNLSSDSDTEFTTVPADRTNKNTFLGAMNFLIDLILQYNPYARIALVGHYENDRKTRISLAQIALAEYWDFPLLRMWEKTGWSQKRVAGTAALWSTLPYSTYSGGQNTSVDMTLTRIWMPDDLHPHTDTSMRAQTLLTNISAEFLRSIF